MCRQEDAESGVEDDLEDIFQYFNTSRPNPVVPVSCAGLTCAFHSEKECVWSVFRTSRGWLGSWACPWKANGETCTLLLQHEEVAAPFATAPTTCFFCDQWEFRWRQLDGKQNEFAKFVANTKTQQNETTSVGDVTRNDFTRSFKKQSSSTKKKMTQHFTQSKTLQMATAPNTNTRGR